MNTAETLEVHLNVLGTFSPELSSQFAETPFVFLANGHPETQRKVLAQATKPQAHRRRHDEPLDRDRARLALMHCSARWTAWC